MRILHVEEGKCIQKLQEITGNFQGTFTCYIYKPTRAGRMAHAPDGIYKPIL